MNSDKVQGETNNLLLSSCDDFIKLLKIFNCPSPPLRTKYETGHGEGECPVLGTIQGRSGGDEITEVTSDKVTTQSLLGPERKGTQGLTPTKRTSGMTQK